MLPSFKFGTHEISKIEIKGFVYPRCFPKHPLEICQKRKTFITQEFIGFLVMVLYTNYKNLFWYTSRSLHCNVFFIFVTLFLILSRALTSLLSPLPLAATPVYFLLILFTAFNDPPYIYIYIVYPYY